MTIGNFIQDTILVADDLDVLMRAEDGVDKRVVFTTK